MTLSKCLLKCLKINSTALICFSVLGWTPLAQQRPRSNHWLANWLLFVLASVRAAYIFMQRRPNDLRSLTHKQQRSHPSSQMLADLRWWSVFLASYNGVSLIRSEPQINNSLRFCTDASLHGNSGRLIHATYPLFITSQSLHINALEMLAVTVSVKLFASVLPTHSRTNRQQEHKTCYQSQQITCYFYTNLPARTMALRS